MGRGRKRDILGARRVCLSVKIPSSQPTSVTSGQAPLKAAMQGQFTFDKGLTSHADPAGEISPTCDSEFRSCRQC